MLYDRTSFTTQTEDWSCFQKVMLHAVMAKMALIIYGEQKHRNEQNDYVKFAYDVLNDYIKGKNDTESEANIKVADWSLDAYIKSIDKWVEKQKVVEDKELYHAKASILTVGLAALRMIPILQKQEIISMLADVEFMPEHHAFVSSQILDYCNMLFIEGMEIVSKKMGLNVEDKVKERKEDRLEDLVMPDSDDVYIVRRTILWDFRKRVLLQAVLGHLSNIVVYEWPEFEPAIKYITEATYIVNLYKIGAHEKVVTSAVNVGTILIDELLIAAKSYRPNGSRSGKFNVYEMISNTVRVAIECVYSMKHRAVEEMLNGIYYDNETKYYESEKLVALVDVVLTLAEDQAEEIKEETVSDEELEDTFNLILRRKDQKDFVSIENSLISPTASDIISKQPEVYYKRRLKKMFKCLQENEDKLTDNDFISLEYAMRDWLWRACKIYDEGRPIVALYIVEAVITEYSKSLKLPFMLKRLEVDRQLEEWLRRYFHYAVNLLILFAKDVDIEEIEPMVFNMIKVDTDDFLFELDVIDVTPFITRYS